MWGFRELAFFGAYTSIAWGVQVLCYSFFLVLFRVDCFNVDARSPLDFYADDLPRPFFTTPRSLNNHFTGTLPLPHGPRWPRFPGLSLRLYLLEYNETYSG